MDDRFEQPVRVRDAMAFGITRAQTRTARWEHPFRGVVRLGDPPTCPQTRIADVIPLVIEGCALGGWASAYLQGVRYLDGTTRGGELRAVVVHAGEGHQLRRRAGLRPSRRTLRPWELEDFDGVRVSSLSRAIYDEALDAHSLTEALVAVEMGVSTVAGHAHTTLARVRQVADSHVKTRGIVQAREALRRASTRSGSPWETRLRILAEDLAGIDDWLVNVPVFDLSGNLLGVPDLLDAESGLVLESDGAGHREEHQHGDDNLREERFERHNLTVVRVMARDHRDPLGIAVRINRARNDAARRDMSRDTWTLDQPGWWQTWEPGRRWRTEPPTR